ncbi:MAG: MlaE family lipid ABC transporter permease subunit [Proteobacteria bacterium]|nr:MlaE family lipid ABC transporter permease subunit [Pseudomonadota bacterium]
MAALAGRIKSERDGARLVVSLGGRWGIDEADRLDGELRRLAPGPAKAVSIDIAGVEALDTAAALVLYRARKRLRADGHAAEFARARPELSALLDLIEANDAPVECRAPREPPLRAIVAHVGRATIEALDNGLKMLSFFGLTMTTLARAAIRPWRIRGTALVGHMEQAGLDAVPIVALISFLIGVVLAYQGADQLAKFGAEIFVVNLVGISVLREIGILLTAIVIAGRSGSAFTAAIGSMKVREEIDAMRTLGLDPIEVLVLPRLLALIVTLPLLAFFADAMGLLGGGLMAWISLGIGPAQFIERLGDAVPMWSFWVGIIKAPVFAFLIAMVGCYEGFQVSGSAESVGRHTTKAVVEAIFLVIVVDAAFSILFAYLGV